MTKRMGMPTVELAPLAGGQPGSLRLADQLCFPLYAASNALTRAYRPLLRRIGLTYPQYLVMLVLWEREELSVSALGRILTLDSGTLSPLLKRLATAGLVERRRDPEDERSVRIRLTAAGQALRQQAAAIPGALLCRVGLPVAELAELRANLYRLLTLLDDAP